jgi:hypothetical protein
VALKRANFFPLSDTMFVIPLFRPLPVTLTLHPLARFLTLFCHMIVPLSPLVRPRLHLVRQIPISPAECWRAAYLSPWSWRQYAPLKRRSTTRLHGAITRRMSSSNNIRLQCCYVGTSGIRTALTVKISAHHLNVKRAMMKLRSHQQACYLRVHSDRHINKYRYCITWQS